MIRSVRLVKHFLPTACAAVRLQAASAPVAGARAAPLLSVTRNAVRGYVAPSPTHDKTKSAAGVILRSWQTEDGRSVVIRHPLPSDGYKMHDLAVEVGLDKNSHYAYNMFCLDFTESCAVVMVGDQMAGFVMAHAPPRRPEALFVWQVGVSAKFRVKGLARQIISAIVTSPVNKGKFTHVEASVTPDNIASHKLFQGVAKIGNTSFKTLDNWMPAAAFGPAKNCSEAHPREDLYRIGPLTFDHTFDHTHDRTTAAAQQGRAPAGRLERAL